MVGVADRFDDRGYLLALIRELLGLPGVVGAEVAVATLEPITPGVFGNLRQIEGVEIDAFGLLRFGGLSLIGGLVGRCRLILLVGRGRGLIWHERFSLCVRGRCGGPGRAAWLVL